jgi:aromatic ring-opening dioxygenase LigB subunit
VILAAAVCPHPPSLVPQLAPGTDDELGWLREACAAAVRTVLDTGPGRIVVIGPGDHGVALTADLDESAGGTLAAYGVDVRAGGADVRLPLSLTIGAWLLDAAGWHGPRTYSTGRPDVSGDVGLLVMADGTISRSVKAPGFFDERAEAYDGAIAAALRDGDPTALAAVDPHLGAELGAAGVPALLTLAALTEGAAVTAHLRHDDAPLGVGYVVADWLLRECGHA